MRPLPLILPSLYLILSIPLLAQTQPSTQPTKNPTLAILPFIPSDPKEKDLAEKLRFAVAQKLSTDQNNKPLDTYARLDNVKVDQILSALQISAVKPLDPDDLQQLLSTLNTDLTIAGTLKGRTLSLTLYQNANPTPAKTATIEIPPDKESPKLAVEKIVTDLTGATFARIRDTESDHSDPAAEARFAKNPNLVLDPLFVPEWRNPPKPVTNWTAILGPNHYAPPLLTATAAATLPEDRVAIVPQSVAMDGRGEGAGLEKFALMMRLSKNTAESNGLACESTFIPITQNKKYRFSVLYHSTGPTARLFLKGFAEKPDQFSNPNDPETSRREFYRAQILPRKKNDAWDLIEMDFAPSPLNKSDPPIQWLKIDLYIYLTPGTTYFQSVTLKELDP